MTRVAAPPGRGPLQGFNVDTYKANQVAFLTGCSADFQGNPPPLLSPTASYERGHRYTPSYTAPYQSDICSGKAPSYHNQQTYYSGATSYPNKYNGYRGPQNFNNRQPQNHFSSCGPQNSSWCYQERTDRLSFGLQNLSIKDHEQEILTILRQLGQGQALQARAIARQLKIDKKVANHHLYKLLHKGSVSVKGESPKFWSIGGPSVERSVTTPNRVKEQNTKVTSPYKGRSTDNRTQHSRETTHQVSLQNSKAVSGSITYDNTSLDSESSSVTSEENFDSATMVVNKEKICEFLFGVEPSTALTIAKNIGLSKSKDVNFTLYQLEKQGDICREATTSPPKWSLTEKKRERIQLKRKAHEVLIAETLNEEDEGIPLDNLDDEPEDIAENCNKNPEDEVNGEEKPVGEMEEVQEINTLDSDEPPNKRMKEETCDNLNGSFANDDIPEGLNSMNKDPAELSLIDQPSLPVEVPRLTPLEKLVQCNEKNAVSGLIEYTQYMGLHCEFILLQQTGPSHDPRFKIQAVIDGRQFPPVVASSKRVAKKDAAAIALKVLTREANGEEEGEEAMPVEELADTVELVPAPAKSLPSGKNPISFLLESAQKMGHTCEFQLVSNEGPAHDPRFTFAVKMGDKTFSAVTASNKKLAKQLAAEAAVKELAWDTDSLVLPEKVQVPLPQPEIQNDDAPEVASEVPVLTPEDLQAAKSAGIGDLIKYLNANPVSGLLEYARANGFAAEFNLVDQSGPPHDPKFVFQAKVGGRWFPAVSAHSKKQAKQEAADAALRVLIGDAEKAVRTGESTPQLPLSGSTSHDQIAMLSHQRFNSLTARVQHSLLGRKILAAIIMRNEEGDMGTVVSIGTGNRCVKGEELSLKGETVNDCHAEVISRRGFIRFLYSELLKYDEAVPESSIFEVTEGGKFAIKAGITFHLYISTAPCGDGALFDKSCTDPPTVPGDITHHPLFENPKQGKLRTKVENGEGTIPVESSDIVPTWDGIQHGERLRTMSCSDKILRWNVLGLQGAILTHFMEPVYLNSITLGYLYSQGHLTRAVCCRLSKDGDAFQEGLPAPFILNHPEVGRVSVYDSTRQTGKTKESSVNWCLLDEDTVEILDGTKGKIDGPILEVSRVSKHNIFLLFQELCRKINREDLLNFICYSDAKEAAVDYRAAKDHFVQALQDMGYGSWICKPQEEKSFTVATE